jgi:hypothetical protein
MNYALPKLPKIIDPTVNENQFTSLETGQKLKLVSTEIPTPERFYLGKGNPWSWYQGNYKHPTQNWWHLPNKLQTVLTGVSVKQIQNFICSLEQNYNAANLAIILALKQSLTIKENELTEGEDKEFSIRL